MLRRVRALWQIGSPKRSLMLWRASAGCRRTLRPDARWHGSCSALVTILMPQPDSRMRFARHCGIYETLSPDARLAPHLEKYRRLVGLHAVWKHGSREDTFDIRPHYRAKTHGLVQDAIASTTLRRDLPVFRIDGTYLDRLDDDGLSGEEKAAEIEAAVVHEIKVHGEHDPIARSLAERLRVLREKRTATHQLTLDLLHEYERLANDYAEEAAAAQASGLTERSSTRSPSSGARTPPTSTTTYSSMLRDESTHGSAKSRTSMAGTSGRTCSERSAR